MSARPAFRFAAALAAVAASPACDLVRPLEVDPDVASVAILLVAGEREARLIAVHPHRQPGEAAPTLTATLKGQGWTAVFSQAPELQTCTRTYAHDWPGPARCLHAVLPQEIRGGEKYEIEGTAPLGAFSGEVVLPAAPVLIEPEDGLHLPMPAEDEDLLIPVRYRTGTDVGTLLAHLVVLEMEEDGTETEIDLCCIPLEPLEGRTRLVISSDVRPLLLSLRMRILGIGWNYTNVLENEGIFPLPRPWPSFGIEAEGEGVLRLLRRGRSVAGVEGVGQMNGAPALRGPGRLPAVGWAMATVGIACGGGTAPGHVSIPDRNLRALIESHLGKAAGSPIHEQEMLTLRALVATPGSYERGGIADLEGLQYATNLEELDVSAERWDSAAKRWHNLNDLSDLSPLAGLTRLETLDLSGGNSRITDISPLSGLTGLRRLDLWNAWITDLEPLAGIRELEFLDLTSNNRLSDLSPLSGLTGLRDLRLSHNAIADITPLANLTGLVRLNVSHNRIGDLTPLANLTGLEILSVDGADLSDLEPLAALGGLVHLSAGSCTRWLPKRSRCGAPPDLTSLSGLKDLRTLLLHDNNITDPAPLANLPDLDALSLHDNNISDLVPLLSLTRLRYLNLSSNGIFDGFFPFSGG